MKKIFLTLALAALWILPAAAQIYTDAYLSSVNKNTTMPCGNTGTVTDQIKASLTNAKAAGGGNVNLVCYGTAITITADLFSSITQPITMFLPTHTVTVNANATIPANFTLFFGAGSAIVAGGGFTLTDNSQHIGPNGSTNPTGLGNGTTVIDVSQVAGSPDLTAMTNNAIAACASGKCAYTYRGFGTASLSWSKNPSWPENSDVDCGAMTWNLPHGVSVLADSQTHIHSSVLNACRIVKADTTADYTPVVRIKAGASNVEIDHVQLFPTTKSQLPEYTLTSVETGNGVYHGTFQGADSNGFVGLYFTVRGFATSANNSTNVGLIVTASSATTLTLAKTNTVAETHAGLAYLASPFPVTEMDASTNVDSYTSGVFLSSTGGTITGGAGDTCTLTAFTGGGTLAAATVKLTGTNYIAYASPLTMTAIGSGYGAIQPTATLSDGTAHCTGTAKTIMQFGAAVVHGNFTACIGAPSQCLGREVGLWGLDRGNGSNEGFFEIIAVAADGSTVTVSDDQATHQTSPNYPAWQMWSPYAALSGGWGITGMRGDNFLFNFIHDNSISTDMGIAMYSGGCDCYDEFSNNVFGAGGSHAAMFFGGNSYSNTISGQNTLNAPDMTAVGWNAAYGFAFRSTGGGWVNFTGTLNMENVKYTIYSSYNIGTSFKNFYVENGTAQAQGLYGQLFFPIIGVASTQMVFPAGRDVTDLSQRPGLNTYSTSKTPNPIQPTTWGSIAKDIIPTFPDVGLGGYRNAVCTVAGAETCSTSRTYYAVFVDVNGKHSSLMTYPALTGADTRNSVNYNNIYYPGYFTNGLDAIQCVDYLILSGGVPKSLATCVPVGINFKDDGSFTPTAYTLPFENETANITTTGSINESVCSISSAQLLTLNSSGDSVPLNSSVCTPAIPTPDAGHMLIVLAAASEVIPPGSGPVAYTLGETTQQLLIAPTGTPGAQNYYNHFEFPCDAFLNQTSKKLQVQEYGNLPSTGIIYNPSDFAGLGLSLFLFGSGSPTFTGGNLSLKVTIVYNKIPIF